MKETTRIWTARVAEWRASGLSQQAFCRDRSYSSNSLSTWSVRLQKHADPQRPVTFARVVTATRASIEPSTGTGLVIQVSGIQVMVEPATNRVLLREVISALREVG